MTKANEELYQERERRVLDAIALKKPDRVPIMVFFHFFPARYFRITARDAMYDAEKILEASLKVMIEFEPDMDLSPYASLFYGATLDALDSKQLAWPGHGVAPDVSFQFVEDERMKPDEYDEFFTDMTGFMMRKFWPRAYGALKGFEPFAKVLTSPPT
jgi:hypothetical protein